MGQRLEQKLQAEADRRGGFFFPERSKGATLTKRADATTRRHGGKSKDHRPDLRQMVVGVVLDQSGQPVCGHLWPGNTTDVKSLVRWSGICGSASVWDGFVCGRSGDDQRADDCPVGGDGVGRTFWAPGCAARVRCATRWWETDGGVAGLCGRASRAGTGQGSLPPGGEGGAGWGPSVCGLLQRGASAQRRV